MVLRSVATEARGGLLAIYSAVWLHDRLMRELTQRFTPFLLLANEVLPLQYGLRSGSLPKSGLRGSQKRAVSHDVGFNKPHKLQ